MTFNGVRARTGQRAPNTGLKVKQRLLRGAQTKAKAKIPKGVKTTAETDTKKNM